jgi:hypothetical protein
MMAATFVDVPARTRELPDAAVAFPDAPVEFPLEALVEGTLHVFADLDRGSDGEGVVRAVGACTVDPIEALEDIPDLGLDHEQH